MLVFKKAETEEELGEVYRLRFMVYCRERNFESEEDYPSKCEIDEYDSHAIHFLALAGNEAVGTARLILNNAQGFPIERNCILTTTIKGRKKAQAAEISRFAVSREVASRNNCDRKSIVLGLIRAVYLESKRIGIVYYYAAMAKSFQKLLERCGIPFLQAGPVIDYHGPRAPYISWTRSIEEGTFMKNINFFHYLTTPDSVPKTLLRAS